MQATPLLNGLTPAQFMADYWQKKPLLIRGAMPGFCGVLNANALAGMACDGEVPARLIQCDPTRMDQAEGWQVRHGPFDDEDFAQLPPSHWTLLVQGVNHVLPEAQALLQQFNFIPYARLDDLMVSYAVKGGNVGPHLDSYDVFLLQGAGKRRWRISAQTQHAMISGAPLRLLTHFETHEEWVLEAGDMLYLPPHIAHWGIAEDDACMTYSIGFRAPAARELAIEYLEECRNNDMPDQRYQDPALAPVDDAAAISTEMVQQVAEMLRAIPWSEAQLGPFLARYLTEPKAYVVFQPAKKISFAAFKKRACIEGLVLDLQSQLLHWQGQFFINGGALDVPASAHALLTSFANTRQLSAEMLSPMADDGLMQWFYQTYLSGYLHFLQD